MTSRKDFIKTLGKVSIYTAGCSILSNFILTGCSNIIYTQGSLNGNILSINKTDFLDKNFVVVRAPKMQAPIYLTKDGNNYNALLMLCTHKQCELNPSQNVLVCPCHGSEFSTSGKVMHPPASRDLKTYKVSTNEKSIFIHLD